MSWQSTHKFYRLRFAQGHTTMNIRLQQTSGRKHILKKHTRKQIRIHIQTDRQVQQSRWRDVVKHLPPFSVSPLHLQVTDEVREGSPFF